MDIRFTGQFSRGFSVLVDLQMDTFAHPVPRLIMDHFSGGLITGARIHVDATSEQRSARKFDNSISQCAEFGASKLELSKSR